MGLRCGSSRQPEGRCLWEPHTQEGPPKTSGKTRDWSRPWGMGGVGGRRGGAFSGRGEQGPELGPALPSACPHPGLGQQRAWHQDCPRERTHPFQKPAEEPGAEPLGGGSAPPSCLAQRAGRTAAAAGSRLPLLPPWLRVDTPSSRGPPTPVPIPGTQALVSGRGGATLLSPRPAR